ncbi:MAG: hypothetical protein WC365_01045 [Candidatus Babeliales bacterium]|jgi:hypothetical protein
MKWTETQDTFLREQYAHMNPYELSKWVGHSEESVETRLKFLKLKKNGRRIATNTKFWTYANIRMLKSLMHLPNKEIAKEMKRTTTSVRKMKEKLRKGLTHPVPYNEHDFVATGAMRPYRKVVEEVIGRKLSSDEHVHHINLNKKDNHPKNLFPCHSPSEHGNVHAQLDNLLYSLVEELILANVIIFADGNYYLGKGKI